MLEKLPVDLRVTEMIDCWVEMKTLVNQDHLVTVVLLWSLMIILLMLSWLMSQS